MTVLSEVERGRDGCGLWTFLSLCFIIVREEIIYEKWQSITGRERGDGAFFIKIIAFVKSEPFHYRHQLYKEGSQETTQYNNIYRGDQSWVKWVTASPWQDWDLIKLPPSLSLLLSFPCISYHPPYCTGSLVCINTARCPVLLPQALLPCGEWWQQFQFINIYLPVTQ